MLGGVALAVATQFAITFDKGFERVGLGFLAAVFLYIIGAAVTPRTEGSALRLSRQAEVAALGGILVLATFLRVWRVWDFPPGLWFDEIFYGLDALDILHNDHFQVWSTQINGRPMLFMYMLAAIFKVFGVSEMTMRSLPIAVGVVTVGAFYLLARHLLGQVPGLVATFFLAVSRWQITFSRITWEASMMPLMLILSLFFLLKALETRRWYYYAAAGVSIGTGLYTYLAFRLVPVALVIVLLYVAWREWPLFRRSLPALVGAAAISVIVFLPLGQYALTHQEAFFHRSNQVDLCDEFNCQRVWQSVLVAGAAAGMALAAWRNRRQIPIWLLAAAAVAIGALATLAWTLWLDAGDLGPLWENVRKVANMFNVHGDRNGRHNIPNEPMLDEVSAALLVIGAGVSLAAWRNWRLGSMLLLAGLMAVPSIFTLTSENPSAIRVLGMVPPLFLLIGLASKQLLESSSTWFGRWWLVAPLVAAVLTASAAINYYDFFERQANDPTVYADFGPNGTIVANRVAAEAGNHEIIISASFRNDVALVLLVPDVPTTEFAAGRDVPFRREPENDLLFILDPQDARSIPALRFYHPEGQAEEVLDPFGHMIYATFSLSQEAATASLGLQSRFYAGDDTAGTPLTTETLLFPAVDWGERGTPLEPPFTMVWEGTLFSDSYATHTLEVASPGHVALELDGSLLAEGEDLVTVQTEKPLPVGPHALRVTLGVERPTGVSELRWLRPGETALAVVPTEALLNTDVGKKGFVARYFPGLEEGNAPILVARQVTLGPVPLIPAPYSAELFGRLKIEEPGEYQFALSANQESLVYLDGELLLERGPTGGGQAETRIALTAGSHDMVVRYVDPDGLAYWSLEWAPPNRSLAVPPLDIFQVPEGGVSALPARPVVGTLKLDVSWGANGRQLPGIEAPVGIAIGPDGDIYVLDGPDAGGDVRVFDATGTPLRDWESGLDDPSDIDVDADGIVYVVGADDGLRRFLPDGTLDREFRGPYATARGVTVGPDGTVYVANPSLSAVIAQNEAGATTQLQPPRAPNGDTFMQPTDVVWAPADALFAVTAELPSIWKITTQGGYLLHWTFWPSITNAGAHLAWHDGLLLATDPEGGRVLAYDAEGRLLASGHLPPREGEEAPKPVGIASGDGLLWTVAPNAGIVYRFIVELDTASPP